MPGPGRRLLLNRGLSASFVRFGLRFGDPPCVLFGVRPLLGREFRLALPGFKSHLGGVRSGQAFGFCANVVVGDLLPQGGIGRGWLGLRLHSSPLVSQAGHFLAKDVQGGDLGLDGGAAGLPQARRLLAALFYVRERDK